MHHVELAVDRIRNRYYERIIDKESGEVVREVDEPLADHVGRGSAKKNREGKEIRSRYLTNAEAGKERY